MLIRIVAPHFVAGLEYRIGISKYNIGKIIKYCKTKHWNLHIYKG